METPEIQNGTTDWSHEPAANGTTMADHDNVSAGGKNVEIQHNRLLFVGKSQSDNDVRTFVGGSKWDRQQLQPQSAANCPVIPVPKDSLEATRLLVNQKNQGWAPAVYDERIEELKSLLTKSQPVANFMPQFCIPLCPELYQLSNQTVVFSHRHGVWVEISGINDAAIIGLHSTNLVSFTVSTLSELLDADISTGSKRRVFLSAQDEKDGCLLLSSSIPLGIADVWTRRVGKFLEMGWGVDLGKDAMSSFLQSHVDFVFYTCYEAVLGIISDYLRNLHTLVKTGQSVSEYNFWLRGRMQPMKESGMHYPAQPRDVLGQGTTGSQDNGRNASGGDKVEKTAPLHLSYPAQPCTVDCAAQNFPAQYCEMIQMHGEKYQDSCKLRFMEQAFTEQLFKGQGVLGRNATFETLQKLEKTFKLLRIELAQIYCRSINPQDERYSEVAKLSSPDGTVLITVKKKHEYEFTQNGIKRTVEQKRKHMAQQFSMYMDGLHLCLTEKLQADQQRDKMESQEQVFARPAPYNLSKFRLLAWSSTTGRMTEMHMNKVEQFCRQKIAVDAFRFDFETHFENLKLVVNAFPQSEKEKNERALRYLRCINEGKYNEIPNFSNVNITEIKESEAKYYINIYTGRPSDRIDVEKPTKKEKKPESVFGVSINGKVKWYPLDTGVRAVPRQLKFDYKNMPPIELGTIQDMCKAAGIEIKDKELTPKQLGDTVKKANSKIINTIVHADIIDVCFYRAVGLCHFPNTLKVDAEITEYLIRLAPASDEENEED